MPEEISAGDLDPAVRAELRSLARPTAATVAGHLVAAGRILDEDPKTALAHAIAARRLASRIAAVREAVGIAAYHAEQWQTAIAELRTYHRMSGRLNHLALVADCERALGRPERAVDLYRSTKPDELDRDDAIELLIVAAGARRDLGQAEAALAMLQVPELNADTDEAARLRYAYADALLELDRRDEAREWFARAVEADREGATDAAERLLEMDGVTLEELEEPDYDEDEDEDVAEGEDEDGFEDEFEGQDGFEGQDEDEDVAEDEDQGEFEGEDVGQVEVNDEGRGGDEPDGRVAEPSGDRDVGRAAEPSA